VKSKKKVKEIEKKGVSPPPALKTPPPQKKIYAPTKKTETLFFTLNKKFSLDGAENIPEYFFFHLL